MPHGGGHHGGGHHGGGHHGGGWGGGHHHGGGWGHHHHGWGSHHHHDHHLGRRWGGGWGWGWGPYGYAGSYRYQRGRFYRGWGFCIGMFMVVTLIIVLSVSLSVRYNDYDSNSDNAFAPGDTRILSYSSSFCDGLSVSGDQSATLYLLRNTPPLSGPTNTLSAQFQYSYPPDDYEYLYYYLYPGSKVSMTYCLGSSSGSLTFALIKGKGNFGNWKDDPYSSYAVKQFTVSNRCSAGAPAQFSYTVTSQDTYFFVFDNTAYYNTVDLTATLHLNRTEYLPSQGGVYDSCSTSYDESCSVQMPYDSDYVALLQVSSTDTPGSDTNLYYSWSCSPRVWVYVLIVLLPLLFVLAMTLVALTVCIVYVRKRSQKYTTLSATVATETPADPVISTVTTTTATTPSAPPPVNAGYNAPPSYGATQPVGSAYDPPPYPTEGSKN